MHHTNVWKYQTNNSQSSIVAWLSSYKVLLLIKRLRSDIWRPRRSPTFRLDALTAVQTFQCSRIGFQLFSGLHLSSLMLSFQVSIDFPDLAGKTQSSFTSILSLFEWYSNVRKFNFQHLHSVDPPNPRFAVSCPQVLMISSPGYPAPESSN
jgi:hypothetical protein